MRALGIAIGLVLVVALGGCSASGYLMGLRQDKVDRAALLRVVARQQPGAPFAARGLLVKPWTRLWVFGDRASAQGIEDRIGLPFPRTEQPVARGASYLVFVDAEQVLSSFSVVPGAPVSFTCLHSLRPYVPSTRLALRRGARRDVVEVGRLARCR